MKFVRWLKACFDGEPDAALSPEVGKSASRTEHNPPGFEMPTGASELHSTSPDGRYCVQVMPWEARNTLWVYSPCIVDTQRRICVFRFADACWSVDRSVWLSDTVVELGLRKFPGHRTGSGVRVVVDCERRVAYRGEGKNVALSRLESELETMISS
jgi:hypothetical protein